MKIKMRLTMMIKFNLTMMIMAGFLLVFPGCSPSKNTAPPQTEPAPAGAEGSLERFPGSTEEQPPAGNTASEKKEETGAGQTTEPGQTTTLPSLPVKPGSEESIPLITPVQKSVPVLPIEDMVHSGIVEIFREFGYSGTIEVPENFSRKVADYIQYFTTDPKGSRFYLRAMGRGSVYLPMILKIFKERRLPLSLAYLPIIESGFNPNSRSRAGAVGIWQFMTGTARMYGLKIHRHFDERRDPIKSTVAAAEYLNDLLAMFGAEDPFLGICAYNAGEGKILKALRQISFQERSFWTLVKKNLLQSETDNYIPQFIAVIIMGKNPHRFIATPGAGTTEPLTRNETTEADSSDQEVIAALHPDKVDLFGPTEETTEVSKTSDKESEMISPDSHRETSTPKPETRVHLVKKGETLYRIAKNYQVSIDQLREWNGIKGNQVFVGQKLKIFPDASPYAAKTPVTVPHGKTYKIVYTVNYKDSLARIALIFKGVSARDIMRWNRLKRTRIHPRQRLVVYLKERPKKVVTHTVKPGETAAKIARRYGLRIEYILSLNGLLTNSRLKPGQKLKIYHF